jgi:hypothetical protein
MAYKNFNIGEEALAADVNTLLMGQTVSRFPSAATRAAQLPGPAVNQLSMTDDRIGVVQYWNGAGWADLVPPNPLPAGFHLQSQNAVYTTDVYGGCGQAFPVPWAGLPTIVAIEAGGLDCNCSIFHWSNTEVFFNIRNMDGVPISNGLVRVMWIATGLR